MLNHIRATIGRSFARHLFRRGYVIVPTQQIERLESSALANHAAQRNHPLDSYVRGYFNGLADQASKMAYEFKRFYPA